MTTYIYTPSGASATSSTIGTNKVRIAAVTAIAYNIGNSAVTANITGCPIIPGGVVERDINVGQGNYIAYISIGSATPQPFSITELGAATTNQS